MRAQIWDGFGSSQLQVPYVDVFSCLTHNLCFQYGAPTLAKQSIHLSGAANTRPEPAKTQAFKPIFDKLN